MIRFLRLLPFVFLIAVAAILFGSLYSQKQTTSLVGTTLPTPELTRFSGEPFPKPPMIINLFASWCAPCIEELPLLEQLAKHHDIPVVGIAWKDKESALTPWLEKYGNPYQSVLLDTDGAYGISLGLRGLPETYIIDAEGVIRYHLMGPITQDNLAEINREIEAAK